MSARAADWLLHSGVVLDDTGGVHDSVLLREGRIAAVGRRADLRDGLGRAGRQTDLGGAVVTAGFVDAHVHLSATGYLITGLDLRGVRSAAELLEALRRHCRDLPADATVLGHGWDETTFTEPGLPTTAQVHAAVDGRKAYLTRIDVHSALVSTSLLAAARGIEQASGHSGDGPVTRAAHGLARQAALDSISPQQRSAAQAAALRECARLGIVSVHENGGPVVGGEADLLGALELGRQPGNPEVIGFWGELQGFERARDLRCHGVAGDLFVDGALGSRTACTHTPYADSETCGAMYIDGGALREHLSAALRLGVQAGFHAIGDAALSAVLAAAAESVRETGVDARSIGLRIEHAEMLDPAMVAMMADLGVIASMQPMFDRLWGGSDGMYAQRLGAQRALTMNPLADLSAAGVHLAFGSDSPVTQLGPWAAVHAAANHRTAGSQIPIAAAMHAHTSGAARAARASEVEARLAPGGSADIAVWTHSSDGDCDAGAILAQMAAAGAERPLPAALVLRGGAVLHSDGSLV